MELHVPSKSQLIEGDLLKWYGYGYNPCFGIFTGEFTIINDVEHAVVIRTNTHRTLVSDNPQFGDIDFVEVNDIDKLFRFNPFNPDEHGSDVCLAHTVELRGRRIADVNFYAYGTPKVTIYYDYNAYSHENHDEGGD